MHDELLQRSSTRQVLPDRLRGIALLGIVVVNAPFLGLSIDGFTSESIVRPVDRLVAFLVFMLAQGKFYVLFSFLFGYSATFILREGHAPDRRRFRRRLIGLGAIGFVHAVFFYIGDILLTYAVLGFGLLAVAGTSDRVLRRWGSFGALVGVLVAIMVVIPLAILTPGWAAATDEPSLAAVNAALADGSFLQAAWARLLALPRYDAEMLLFQGPMAFGAFCFGLLAARRQLLADPSARLALWRRCAIVGLSVGLPVQAVTASLQIIGLTDHSAALTGTIGTALGFAFAPILSVGYLGLLGWAIARRPRTLKLAEWPGRASLSVYVGESALLSLLFCGYGLGMFGQWGALAVVAAGTAAWLLLSVASALWLGRFVQGPLEQLMARWTGKAAPIR